MEGGREGCEGKRDVTLNFIFWGLYKSIAVVFKAIVVLIRGTGGQPTGRLTCGVVVSS